MNYQEFKDELIEKLRGFYGKDAEVRVTEKYVVNSGKKDAVCILFAENNKKVCPSVSLDSLYGMFQKEEKNLDECAGMIIEIQEEKEMMRKIESRIEEITDWEEAKRSVYPMLILTEKNEPLLQEMVFTPYLDFSVIYYLRMKTECKERMEVKITRNMLEKYGISPDELHRQAMGNMKQDGYSLISMEDVLQDMLLEELCGKCAPDCFRVKEAKELEKGKLYILTNRRRSLGAAGVLDGEMLKEKLGDTSCYAIPSSVHEWIFLPVAEELCPENLNRMVQEVNETQLAEQDVLSEHVYFYNGIKKKLINMA